MTFAELLKLEREKTNTLLQYRSFVSANEIYNLNIGRDATDLALRDLIARAEADAQFRAAVEGMPAGEGVIKAGEHGLKFRYVMMDENWLPYSVRSTATAAAALNLPEPPEHRDE